LNIILINNFDDAFSSHHEDITIFLIENLFFCTKEFRAKLSRCWI